MCSRLLSPRPTSTTLESFPVALMTATPPHTLLLLDSGVGLYSSWFAQPRYRFIEYFTVHFSKCFRPFHYIYTNTDFCANVIHKIASPQFDLIHYRVKYSKAAAAVAAMNQLFQRPLCSESSHNTTIAALDNIFRRGHNTVSFFFDDATQRRRPIWFTKRV